MIATILSVHENVECGLDTLESIRKYVGDNVLVVVDGAYWHKWEHLQIGVYKMKGFNHGVAKSTYRNVALGLKSAAEIWSGKVKWFCHTEYDALFASDKFKNNLDLAEEKDVWMLGNDGHIDTTEIPLVESLYGSKFKSYYYLLGCCMFFSSKFMDKLVEINFFDRFLNLTNQFTEGYMPGYTGYDVSEHMYPSLCREMGGNVGVFASYDQLGQWHGNYRSYPMRWRPTINPDTENYPESFIIHPLKEYDHPIRAAQREARKNGV